MLDYLFIAEYYTGETIKQTPIDTSKRDKKKSEFYDVINYKKVKRFSLVGKGHIFTVDLTDGHFEIDGRTIYTKRPPSRAALDLIYYRQVQQRLYTNDRGGKTMTPIIRYYIGWQTQHKGKNYKFELGVD